MGPPLFANVRLVFFFQAEDGIRDIGVTGVQTCALPICPVKPTSVLACRSRVNGASGFSTCRATSSGVLLENTSAPPTRQSEKLHRSVAHKIGRASCRERV